MHEGTVKKIVFEKGFGFLAVPGREKDLFFHLSGLVSGVSFKDLKEGDKVTFKEILKDMKGESAIGIDLVM